MAPCFSPVIWLSCNHNISIHLPFLFFFIASLCIFTTQFASAASQLDLDRQSLLGFLNNVDHDGSLLKNWTGTNPCANWDGVTCNKKGWIWQIVLESRHLSGQIRDNTIASLPKLRLISLKNNSLSGPIPRFQSPFLRNIWLNYNAFNGSMPDIFASTVRLNRLDLSNNFLSGQTPDSLASVANLMVLRLENNQLTGSMPPLNQSTLIDFNVSRNQLSGQIPDTYQMRRFSELGSFQNNPGLCGSSATAVQCSPPQTSAPRHGFWNRTLIVLFVVGDILLLLLVLLVAVYCCKSRKRKSTGWKGKGEIKPERSAMSIEDTALTYEKANRQEVMTDTEKSKLVVFDRPGQISFDLEELLRASAEMLGKGNFGTAYKAVLKNGPAVVVKRLRRIHSAGKNAFNLQMHLLGEFQHPNVAPLFAYYYAKDEKFLVYPYIPNGSLFYHLHGNRGPGRLPLDWDTRLRIARGTARGMVYLHTQLKDQQIPHGNLKSTNILLDERMTPKIIDFGLVPVVTSSDLQFMAGFKAPEYNTIKRSITEKADVYSYGVILLELLTGKVPAHATTEGGADLAKWVSSINMREDWTSEIFDVELGASKRSEKLEMISVLQIAMKCIATLPEERPSMEQVAKFMMDEIREVESPKVVFLSPDRNSFASDSTFVSTDYGTPRVSFESRRSINVGEFAHSPPLKR